VHPQIIRAGKRLNENAMEGLPEDWTIRLSPNGHKIKPGSSVGQSQT
jgi:hypothetical protein